MQLHSDVELHFYANSIQLVAGFLVMSFVIGKAIVL